MNTKLKTALFAALILGVVGITQAQAGLIECTMSGFPPMLHCKVG